jgi:hypothetical protein
MASLELVFNHLVLPAKLPGHGDQDPEAVSGAILTRLLKACELLGKVVGEEWAREWESVGRSLRTCQGIHQKRLEAKLMLQDWAHLQPKDFLILRIAEQNAALLLHYGTGQVKQSSIYPQS